MADFRPTPEQDAILAHDPKRHARVLAGPGTGKSATLVALIDSLLTTTPECNLRLLTFTRAATGELAQKVSEHPASATQRPSTIHSFALSLLLRSPGAGDLPEPLRIADDWERDRIVYPTLARHASVPVKRLKKLVAEMASNWESLRDERDARVDPRERVRFQAAWGEHRRLYGYTLLQELPYALRKALTNHPDLEGCDFDLLVVDEYQDLNACDLDVIRLIAERGCSVIGAGDDDQSIYSFRKADPEGIRRFADDYPGAADYPLSITQRCGTNIVAWASHVIEGDLGRPPKARLTPAYGSPAGETALLGYPSQIAEARGIATLVKKLVEVEGLAASDILILLRGDYQGSFSNPIKAELDNLGIPYSDPDSIDTMLAQDDNRRMLETLRLLASRDDSLAWAGLLELTLGIGERFGVYVQGKAQGSRSLFGAALLEGYEDGFPAAPLASAKLASQMIESVLVWLDAHPLPDDNDLNWGQWIVEVAGGEVVPSPTDELCELLLALDQLVEPDATFNRYLGQITPLGKDRERNESRGVRIMTMASAKGLTVRATIVAALEEGIVPRPDVEMAEERRLLYVAMTRSKEFVYGTWARRRIGPTARAGTPRVRGRRSPCHFLDGGPAESLDGAAYVNRRWPEA